MLFGNAVLQFSFFAASASAFVLEPNFLMPRNASNSTGSSTTCELGNGIPKSEYPQKAMLARDLEDEFSIEARAPRVYPLVRRDQFRSSTEFLQYIQDNVPHHGENDIPIVPTDEQLETWIVGTRSKRIPVGATAPFLEFGNRPEFYKMRGLSGCTGSFLVSEYGMWAGHLWESTRPSRPNGGSAFLERLRTGEEVERGDSEFKMVGIDILDERTPREERNNRIAWQSLRDVAVTYNDPFGRGTNPEGFIFTKAKSGRNPAQKYRGKVSMLKRAYETVIRGIRMHETVTYPGVKSEYPRDFPESLKGVVVAQYSPCYRISSQDGRCYARFEIYTEKNSTPVFVKEWKAHSGQR